MKGIIIGGGIAGLTTAISLKQAGIDVAIYEAAPEIKPIGAGIWLAVNAIQVLKHLGLLEIIRSNSYALEEFRVTDYDGNILQKAFEKDVIQTFGEQGAAIHRGRLQQNLIDALGDIPLYLGKRCKNLDTENLIVTFEDGTQIQADFIIGADGIHSIIRKHLFPFVQLRHSGQTCWRGVADYSLGLQQATEMWGKQLRFGIVPILEKETYWFAVSSKALDFDAKKATKSDLLQLYLSFAPPVSDIISATPQDKMINNDLLDFKPLDTKWFKGNICLIGDAAHAMTPNMGQGGCQAIEDAYFIGQAFKKHKNPLQAFDFFYKKRYKKVKEIVVNSYRIGQLAHIRRGHWFRNFIVKNSPKSLTNNRLKKLYSIDY